MKRSAALLSYISLYTALCVVVGFLFAWIPNVELITLLIFLGGYFFGMGYGLLIGAVAYFIFSAFNPWGSGLAFPPLLFAQIISFSVTGLCGGIIARIPFKRTFNWLQWSVFGLCGGTVTLFYHVLASLFTAQFAEFSYQQRMRHDLIL